MICLQPSNRIGKMPSEKISNHMTFESLKQLITEVEQAEEAINILHEIWVFNNNRNFKISASVWDRIEKFFDSHYSE